MRIFFLAFGTGLRVRLRASDVPEPTGLTGASEAFQLPGNDSPGPRPRPLLRQPRRRSGPGAQATGPGAGVTGVTVTPPDDGSLAPPRRRVRGLTAALKLIVLLGRKSCRSARERGRPIRFLAMFVFVT